MLWQFSAIKAAINANRDITCLALLINIAYFLLLIIPPFPVCLKLVFVTIAKFSSGIKSVILGRLLDQEV